MSHRKDTDYLAVSARIRAMENRLLTRERMERMIEAKDTAEARKVLSDCGYPDTAALPLEQVLAQAREETLRDLTGAVPEPALVEIFGLKYDYHNAKVLVKAQAVGNAPERLLQPGGRYSPKFLLAVWQQEELRGCSELFRRAVTQAREVLKESRDPQQADLLLDRACYEEMAQLAKSLDSEFLQGYVRLSVDIANLRTAVRVARMGKESDFLRQVLLPGGNVSVQAILAVRPEGLSDVFQSGALAQAAQLGAKLTVVGSGALTAFEKACDDALTEYLSRARRIPFGEQVVIGYVYAKELELTAIRTIFAGRAAGLEPQIIRERLRDTYA